MAKKDKAEIEKLVPDTSVIIEGMVSRKVKAGEIKAGTILIHEAVIAELEHQANLNKTIGFLGLDEIKHLKELSGEHGFSLEFAGLRPHAAEIRNARLGEIDSLIRQLAFETGSTLMTADKVQAEVAAAKNIPTIFVEIEQMQHAIRMESYFDESTMSVHLRENVTPKAKKGMPGNWSFVEVAGKPLAREEVKEMSREIIEEAGVRRDGFVELERQGSTIVQLGPYRIVITRPPLSDGWEITAVRPVKKLALDDYGLSDKLTHRIKEQAEGILIAGAPGMGKCLAGDEIIFTADLKPMTAQEFYKLPVGRLLSIDASGKVLEDAVVRKAKRTEHKLITVTTRTNRRIRVTEEHPLLAFTEKVEWVPAKEVMPGQKIAVMRKLPGKEDDRLELLRLYEPESTLCEVVGIERTLPIHCRFHGTERKIVEGLESHRTVAEIARDVGRSEKHIRTILSALKMKQVIFGKRNEFRLSVNEYAEKGTATLLLEDVYRFGIPLENVTKVAVISNKCRFVRLPKKVNRWLCKFLGYYYAEGGGEKISFTNSNPLLVADFKRAALEAFGVDEGEWKRDNLTNYIDWYASFNPILKGWGIMLKGRKKSRVMRLPDFLNRCSTSNVIAFLTAYFDGDGGVNRGSSAIEYYTSSEEAAHQLVVLLLRLGIFATVRKKWAAGSYRYALSICDKKSLRRFYKQVMPLAQEKQDKIKACLKKPYSQLFSYDLTSLLAPINRYLKIRKTSNCSVDRIGSILNKLYEFYYHYSASNEAALLKLRLSLRKIEEMQGIFERKKSEVTWTFLRKQHIDHTSVKHWTQGRKMKASTLVKLCQSLGASPSLDVSGLCSTVSEAITASGMSVSGVAKDAELNQSTLQLRLQSRWESTEDLYKVCETVAAEIFQTKRKIEAVLATLELLGKSDIVFDTVTAVTVAEGAYEVFDFETKNHNFICGKLPVVVHNSTFAQALAEHYALQDKIVKTVEAPRDLLLPDSITQYAISHGSQQEIHDILLLSRPDYTIFDEMRNTADFELFADLRLAGIGLAGVVHATNPIDAIQRFVGRIELGVIPQIIDTVIFIKNGFVGKVLSLNMTVKVPEGMTEADLARPVVVVNDFETGRLEYELYSYGEETVVIPVSSLSRSRSPLQQFAASALEAKMKEYVSSAKVEMVSDSKCVVYVPEKEIARLIGKEGRNIAAIEDKLGVGIDVQPLSARKAAAAGDGEEENIAYDAQISKKHVVFTVDGIFANKNVKIYADEDYVMTANVGKDGIFKISRKNKIGKVITDAVSSGSGLKVTVSG